MLTTAPIPRRGRHLQMSQGELAAEAFMSRTALGNIEAGKTDPRAPAHG